MLQYERIDASEGVDINKSNKITHYFDFIYIYIYIYIYNHI